MVTTGYLILTFIFVVQIWKDIPTKSEAVTSFWVSFSLVNLIGLVSFPPMSLVVPAVLVVVTVAVMVMERFSDAHDLSLRRRHDNKSMTTILIGFHLFNALTQIAIFTYIVIQLIQELTS